MNFLKNSTLVISKNTVEFKNAVLQNDIYEFLNNNQKNIDLLSAFNKKNISHIRFHSNLFDTKGNYSLSEVKNNELTKKILTILDSNKIKIRSCHYKNKLWLLNNPLNKTIQKKYFYTLLLVLFSLNVTLTQVKFKTENKALNEKYKFEKTKRYLVKMKDKINSKKRTTSSKSLSKIDPLLELPIKILKLEVHSDTSYFLGILKRQNYDSFESKLNTLNNQYTIKVHLKKKGPYFFLKGRIYDKTI
jgi:hypothetical protein